MLLVSGRFDLEFQVSPILRRIALPMMEQVQSLRVLLHPVLLLDKQVVVFGQG